MRFSSAEPAGGGGAAEASKPAIDPRLSKPARLKKQRTDLSGLTREERLAKRRESLCDGDSWEDLHGTKEHPGRDTPGRRTKLKKKTGEGDGSGKDGAGGSGSGDAGEVTQKV